MKNKTLLSIALAMMYSGASAQSSLRQVEAEEDTLHEHFMDIAKTVYPVEKECEVALYLKYNVPKNKARKMAYYIKERERRKACYNYIYKDSILTRVRCKLEMDSIYRDSINTLLIPVKGNRISGDNISLALMLSATLELDDAQYQYMMEKALAMARQLYQDPRSNVWNEEMDVLKKTLTPKQFNSFFLNKNGEKTTKEVDKGWQRLVDAGLAEQLDSATEIPRAYIYYHERQKIKDIFRYYGTPQKKNLAELDNRKPAMVRMIETLDNETRIIEQNKQKEKNKTVGKEFVW